MSDLWWYCDQVIGRRAFTVGRPVIAIEPAFKACIASQ